MLFVMPYQERREYSYKLECKSVTIASFLFQFFSKNFFVRGSGVTNESGVIEWRKKSSCCSRLSEPSIPGMGGFSDLNLLTIFFFFFNLRTPVQAPVQIPSLFFPLRFFAYRKFDWLFSGLGFCFVERTVGCGLRDGEIEFVGVILYRVCFSIYW
jgi:hypothetical protein